MEELKRSIRAVPDFPKTGIVFRDITTLLKDGPMLRRAIEMLANAAKPLAPETIVCVESRGFLLGAPVAASLGVGVIPARKPGKLPAEAVRQEYTLEYGTDAIEIHRDAIQPGRRVLILDDLLATGGTARACVELVEKMGGIICGLLFLIELSYLGGREKFDGHKVISLINYTSEEEPWG